METSSVHGRSGIETETEERVAWDEDPADPNPVFDPEPGLVCSVESEPERYYLGFWYKMQLISICLCFLSRFILHSFSLSVPSADVTRAENETGECSHRSR
jgi:hypothetical protein